MKASNQNWHEWASTIATDGDPRLHSDAAMKRFATLSNDHTIRLPAITGKFSAKNCCALVDFKTPSSKARYVAAYEIFVENCLKLGKGEPGGKMKYLVALGQFRKAAEKERAEIFIDKAVEDIRTKNQSVIIATSFKGTIAKSVRYAIKEYGFKREDISLIWGGDDVFESKNHLSKEEMADIVRTIMKGGVIPDSKFRQFEKQVMMDSDDKEEMEELKEVNVSLGTQDRKSRQKEIDRFQIGRTRLCLFTLAAGGTGISLHHTNQWFETFMRELFEEANLLEPEKAESKVFRHISSGKLFRSYQRRAYISPTYSPQDLIQALGRGHRSMFSLSDTYQDIIWFKDTIEEKVMSKVAKKLRCLSKAVKSKESWLEILDSKEIAQEDNESEEEGKDEMEEKEAGKSYFKADSDLTESEEKESED